MGFGPMKRSMEVNLTYNHHASVNGVVVSNAFCSRTADHERIMFVQTIFRSSPTDDLVDWNLVCSSVRIRAQKVYFSDFDLIWCVGRPRPHMRTIVTSTRSNVKVKVRELPKLRKLHFSGSISSAVSAWSSKLVIGGDSMGLGLQLINPDFWISS